MAKGKGNKNKPRRRRRSQPKAKPARRRRKGGGGKGMSWIPLALALAAGEVAGSTVLAKLPAVLNPQAVVVWAVGHFTNRPQMKEVAYAIQAASMAGPLKEQATKMLAGFSLTGGSTKTASVDTTTGDQLPTVAQAVAEGLQFA